MSIRTLVSVQTITRIDPIAGADRIVLAHVLGWKVIISKDMGLAVGDRVAYFETDSLLPETDPRYSQFMPRGVRHMAVTDPDTGETMEVSGHVLRTMKMRGVYSQGLIMPLPELGIDPALPVGSDITEACRVVKYEPPVFTSRGANRQDKALQRAMQGIIGEFNAPCSKSDAPRAQTLTGVWPELCALHATPTVKVDGMSVTFWFDGDTLRMFTRNYEVDPMHPDWRDAYRLAQQYFTSRIGGLAVLDIGVDMCVQAEYAGPGINGNRQKLEDRDLFVFAVWAYGEKLPRDMWEDSFLTHAVPQLTDGGYELTVDLDALIGTVDGMRGHITPGVPDEGVVWHLDPTQTVSDTVREALGDNLCFKIVNNSYLARHHL